MSETASGLHPSEDVCQTFTDAGLELKREARAKLSSITTELLIEAMVGHHWGEVRWKM